MQYNNNFTIIIFHKGSDPRRILNLKSLLFYLQSIAKFKIIVIEQDKIELDKNEIKKFNVEYIFDYCDGEYCKSKAYNIAANKVNTDFICFHDSDIIIQKHIYTFCINFFKEFDVIKPYNRIVEMNDIESDKFILDNEYFLSTPLKTRESNISGGIMFINRKAFWKIGGWDEEITGWGGEDDIFDNKISKCLKLKLFSSISLHLLHEKIYLKQGYHKNNHIVEKFIKLSKEQILKNAKLKGKKYESSTRNNF